LCSPAKEIVKHNLLCKSNQECSLDEYICMKPVIDDKSSFLKITLNNSSSVVFFGHPLHLWYAVEISSYIPRWKNFLSAKFPEFIERFLWYLLSLSSALAVLNMAPVFFLDGGWACTSFAFVFFPKMQNERRESICKIVYYITTILLVLNVLSSWIFIL